MTEIKNTAALDQDKLDYFICVQFLFMHVACLLVIWTGVSVVAVVTCLALYVVRMFAITAGFHRLLAHRTYRTTRRDRSGGRPITGAITSSPTLNRISIRH